MTTHSGAPSRTWPEALALVVIGFIVAAWSIFIAGIGTAPFFGDTPSRESYIEAGVVSLTAALAVALIWSPVA